MAAKRPIKGIQQEFGKRVRARREELGWSIERLGEAADLHWTYVGSVERGERNISLQNIVRISRALEIGPEELTSGLGTR